MNFLRSALNVATITGYLQFGIKTTRFSRLQRMAAEAKGESSCNQYRSGGRRTFCRQCADLMLLTNAPPEYKVSGIVNFQAPP